MNQKYVLAAKDFLKTYKYKIFGQKALKKYHHWFPLYPTEVLARITANILCDGNLEVRDINNRCKYYYFGFYSQFISELEKFNYDVENLFGIRGVIKQWGRRDYGFSMGCIITNAALIRVMTLCGIPKNEKVSQDFSLPNWILTGNKEIKSSFLKAAFSCEGSIGYDISAESWEIRFFQNKIESLYNEGVDYMNSYKNLLKEFGIETTKVFVNTKDIRTKDNEISLNLCFKIQKPKSILNYARYIGFNNKDKRERLVKAVKWASKTGG